MTNIKARIQHLCKSETDWSTLPDFVPNKGELIIYLPDVTYSIPRIKVGDGSTKLLELPFIDTNMDFDAGRITNYL